MKNLLAIFLALTLSGSLFALDFEGATFSQTRPVDVEVAFNESDFVSQAWINEFRYVVVVNKADAGKEAQSIKVYEYGKLIISDKVSTGRNEFERKGEHGSKYDSWTVTPTGYYTPNFLSKDHRSSAYGGKWSRIFGGVKMPFAIFFNGGIALHQAPKGTEGMLGKKASGGCVRLPGDLASDLFTRIQETQGAKNPLFNVNGTPVLDAVGNLNYSSKSGFSALIIVQNVIVD